LEKEDNVAEVGEARGRGGGIEVIPENLADDEATGAGSELGARRTEISVREISSNKSSRVSRVDGTALASLGALAGNEEEEEEEELLAGEAFVGAGLAASTTFGAG
jgi:hypothetical protein